MANQSSTYFRHRWAEFVVTAGATIPEGDILNILTGEFTGAGARTTRLGSNVFQPCLPGQGEAFRDDPRVEVWMNGVLRVKASGPSEPGNVEYISPFELRFRTRLRVGDVLAIRVLRSL